MTVATWAHNFNWVLKLCFDAYAGLIASKFRKTGKTPPNDYCSVVEGPSVSADGEFLGRGFLNVKNITLVPDLTDKSLQSFFLTY